MTIEEKIDLMRERAQSKVRQKTRRQKIELYAIGVKEKFQEARFSLENLQNCVAQDETVIETVEILSIDEKVHFYCDCFWVFLYATLDVLAQIINQTEQLGLSERRVSFENIEGESLRNLTLKGYLDRIRSIRAFKNLKKYRNCSLHRRHIYFETKSRTGSAGYRVSATSVALNETIRYLCDDPYALSPNIKQQREVGAYCERTFNQISNLLSETIDAILP